MVKLTWPGYNYLGPGNELDDSEPVDSADRIAYIHDILYDVLPYDADASDRLAIDLFVEDFQDTGNWHDLLGSVGLLVKRSFESIYGQIYPNSMSKSHGGREDYKRAQSKLSELYQEHRRTAGKSDKTSWSEFQKLYFKDLLKESHEQRSGSKRPFQSDGDDLPGPSGTKTRVVEESSANTSDEQSNFDIDEFVAGVDWDDSPPEMHQMDVETMEEVANPAEGADGVSGKSGSGQGTGRGGRSSAAAVVTIPRVPKTPYCTRTFRKSYIFFSYGFIHKRIQHEDNINYITPLMLIPVDCLGFYLDATEFTQLRGRSAVSSVRARVKPLGCRVNFQTSASVSSWATSEFVAIGQKAVGLNLCVPGRNRVYNPNATKPMDVTTSGPIVIDDLDEKLYGRNTFTGAISLVPRHLNLYYTPITAKGAGDGTVKFTHSNGPPKIECYVDRFLINTSIGQNIINYEYKPRDGTIVDIRLFDMNNLPNKFSTKSENLMISMNPYTTAAIPPVVQEGRATLKATEADQEQLINDWTNFMTTHHYQYIEMPEIYDLTKGHIQGNVQPQIHVGLTAVPAINPGSDRTDFQNSACYWAVDCECVVHEYTNSAYRFGGVHTNSPAWYRKGYEKKYGSGNVVEHHLNLDSGGFYLQSENGVSQGVEVVNSGSLSAEPNVIGTTSVRRSTFATPRNQYSGN